MEHITVCVCTYKRPELLTRLLKELDRQETAGEFTYSIVVVDNDQSRSADSFVCAFSETSSIRIKYCVEPRQNISLARNRAIENADGDFVCFIDDDEFPTTRWLLTLFQACNAFQVDGVLGPVKSHFDEEPPKWVVKGKFYDRASYPTGFIIDWRKGRTGNTLLRMKVVTSYGPPFDPEFLTGEDQDFFRRMIEKGHRFIWCDEAVAYETVPAIRWRRGFMLKRALFRGAVTLVEPTFGARNIVKSLIAVPAYSALLPLAFILGQHRFMTYLIKLCDHLGTVLAFLGIKPIKVPYVTQ